MEFGSPAGVAAGAGLYFGGVSSSELSQNVVSCRRGLRAAGGAVLACPRSLSWPAALPSGLAGTRSYPTVTDVPEASGASRLAEPGHSEKSQFSPTGGAAEAIFSKARGGRAPSGVPRGWGGILSATGSVRGVTDTLSASVPFKPTVNKPFTKSSESRSQGVRRGESVIPGSFPTE